VRDYLETTGWDKNPPAPTLPENIVQTASDRYREIMEILI
jgi:phosphoribosylaminoimidazole-succinocarboxamide synthase